MVKILIPWCNYMIDRTPLNRLIASIFVALILSMIGNTSAIAGRWNTLEPDSGGDRVRLVVSGNTRTYYRLEPGETMSLDISETDGGKYRIITRADMSGHDRNEVVYTFRIAIDNEEERLYSRASEPTRSVHRRGLEEDRIAQSRTLELEIPAEAEYITIRIGSSSNDAVYFRVQHEQEEYSESADYVFYSPRSYSQAVGISTRERVSTYYMLDDADRLNVEVIGPTTLKVLTRVLLDESMRGRINYSIATYEDGVLKNTFPLSTIASQISVILDQPGVIPSRGESFYVEVPAGRHRYSFTLPENHRQVALRFFIPEQHLTRSSH